MQMPDGQLIPLDEMPGLAYDKQFEHQFSRLNRDNLAADRKVAKTHCQALAAESRQRHVAKAVSGVRRVIVPVSRQR